MDFFDMRSKSATTKGSPGDLYIFCTFRKVDGFIHSSLQLKRCFMVFQVSSLCRNTVLWAASFSPATPWTSRRMVQRPVGIVEKFWCSYPLKGSMWWVFILGANPRFCGKAKYEATKSKRGMSIFYFLIKRISVKNGKIEHNFFSFKSIIGIFTCNKIDTFHGRM
jgi:hypothetical protein